MLKVTESHLKFRTPPLCPGEQQDSRASFCLESHRDLEWPTVLYTDVDSARGRGERLPKVTQKARH